MTQSRIIALIIALLFSATAAHAQTYVFGRANFPVGKEPNSLVLGDFNSDGINDIAVVNSVDNTASILLGKSDGTFIPQVTYATGAAPVAITTGDFNGDGNLDLAVTNGGLYSLRRLRGLRRWPYDYTSRQWRWHISGPCRLHDRHLSDFAAVADLNADGILD